MCPMYNRTEQQQPPSSYYVMSMPRCLVWVLAVSLLQAAYSFQRSISPSRSSPSPMARKAISSLTHLAGLKYDYVYSSPSKEQKKERLDVFLSSALSDHSRSFLGGLCDTGVVTVNDKPAAKSHKLSHGDRISLEIEVLEPITSVTPENIPLNVLYEDDHIIAVNKPEGMVVHPAPGSWNGTFVNALLYHLGPDAKRLLDISDEGGVVQREDEEEEVMDLPETPEAAKASPVSLRPGIVHRLDKGTSGVLLAGKHPEAVAKLSALFAQRKIRKVYLAITVGHPGEATVVEPIGRSAKNRQLMTVYDGPPGKPAVTHMRTLAFDGKLGSVLCRIETGRTHQIRVHLKHRRTPVAGDEAYGNSDWNNKLALSDGIHRPLLHAYETEFAHPITGEQLLIRAPVPSDMYSLLLKISSSTSPLVDPSTHLLTGSTAVEGKAPGEVKGGFIPSDRLVFKEQDWTTLRLVEEDED